MDWLTHSDSPWRFIALPRRWVQKKSTLTQAERVRLALEELGPSYIKLGQAISTRSDLLPPEYILELSKLQDAAPTIPFEQVSRVIVEELGDPPEMLFREFCMTPEAAASISQVHRAIRHDGSSVVVKVQRPGARAKVEEDLLVLRDVASFLTHNTHLGRQYDYLGWLEEFAFTLRNELDFRREGHNADRIRENFREDRDLYVPTIHWDLTTRRVLTMERIEGLKLSDTNALASRGIDRRQLAKTCARIVLTEVFKHGFFHADPHPGNFFVQLDGSVALIDLGMVGRLDRDVRESLIRVTLAIANDEAERLVDEIFVLGTPRGPVRRQDLRVEFDRLLAQYVDGPPQDLSLAHLFNDILGAAARHRIHVPSDLLFLARTIAMCEGLSTTLDPTFDLVAFTREFFDDYFAELRKPGPIKERMQESALELADLSLNLPRKTRRVLDQLERGEICFTTRLENADELLSNVHTATNRLAMAVVIGSLIVGMSYVVSRSESRGTTNSLMQIMLFLAVVGGIGLLASIWRSKRH